MEFSRQGHPSFLTGRTKIRLARLRECLVSVRVRHESAGNSCSGRVGRVRPDQCVAVAADLKVPVESATPPAPLPAIDGINWKFGGLGGSFSGDTIALGTAYYFTDDIKGYVGHRYVGGRNALALGGEAGFRLNGPAIASLFVEGRIG